MMEFADVVVLIFFLLNTGIFIIKIVNIMSYKFKGTESPLKYYSYQWSIVLFIVSLLAWLFMMVAYSAKAVETQFILTYGLPATPYFVYSVYLSLSNIYMILVGLFTFIEIILIGWSEMRNGERYRRNDDPRKVTLR
jgi:hypothetical protein